MAETSLVAWFDKATHAANAVRDLENSGIPSARIVLRVVGSHVDGFCTSKAIAEGRTYWGGPVIGASAEDLKHCAASGVTTVTVRLAKDEVARTGRVLDGPDLIRLEDRGADYSRPVAIHHRTHEAWAA